MINIQDARSILWADAEFMTDEEIQNVIDLLRWVCRMVIDEYFNTKYATDTKDTESEKED